LKVQIKDLPQNLFNFRGLSNNDFLNSLKLLSPDVERAINKINKDNLNVAFDKFYGKPKSLAGRWALELGSLADATDKSSRHLLNNRFSAQLKMLCSEMLTSKRSRKSTKLPDLLSIHQETWLTW
jgi:hypothetical protein